MAASISMQEDYTGGLGVLRFDENPGFKASGLKPLDISDHYPVWANFYDISRFVTGRKYMRGWGFPETETQFEVEGNCQLIACVVLGKPNPTVDVVTAVTPHRRPSNWAVWEPDSDTPPLKVK